MMEIEMYPYTRMAAVWLTQAEREDPEVKEQLEKLYADCKEKKYTVAIFHSGDNNLCQQTSSLLRYNRRRTAQCDGRRM